MSYLERHVAQAAAQGAVVALVLEPQVGLDELTEDDATAFGEELAGLHERLGTHFLVRFAPEMNGWWTSWGRSPRTTCRPSAGWPRRCTTPPTARRWSGPRLRRRHSSDGARRPDRPSSAPTATARHRRRRAPRGRRRPLRPVLPGDRWVDWVGLHMYRYGDGATDNAAPRPSEVEERLRTFTYSEEARRPSFYDRFARPTVRCWSRPRRSRALDRGGASERAIKQRWWRQLSRPSATGRPSERSVAGAAPPEEENDGQEADSRVTHRPLSPARWLGPRGLGIATGPVTRLVEPRTGRARSRDESAGKRASATVK